MRIDEPEAGLFVVEYASADDLSPQLQSALMERVEQAVVVGPTCLVFLVGASVRTVDLTVPTFWLSETGRLRLTGIAVVTQSMVVRAAAKGFALASSVRQVAVFQGEPEALAFCPSAYVFAGKARWLTAAANP